jgi:hypothetical protein
VENKEQNVAKTEAALYGPYRFKKSETLKRISVGICGRRASGREIEQRKIPNADIHNE